MDNKRETLSEKTIRILTTIHRPFIICIDGIWREVMGVYLLPLIEPYKIKYLLNGIEMGTDSNTAVDVYGFNEKYIEEKIIQRNLESLPPLKQKECPQDLPFTLATRFNTRRVVGRHTPATARRGNYWATTATMAVEPEAPPPEPRTAPAGIFVDEGGFNVGITAAPEPPLWNTEWAGVNVGIGNAVMRDVPFMEDAGTNQNPQ